MTRIEALEKLFANEVNVAIAGHFPLGEFAIPKRLRAKMLDAGDIEVVAHRLPGCPPVTVRVLMLTHRGRMDYCATCKDEPESAP